MIIFSNVKRNPKAHKLNTISTDLKLICDCSNAIFQGPRCRHMAAVYITFKIDIKFLPFNSICKGNYLQDDGLKEINLLIFDDASKEVKIIYIFFNDFSPFILFLFLS